MFMPSLIEIPDNVLRNSMRLELTIDEAIYLRGAIKLSLKNMKMSEQYEFVRRVLDRLEDAVLNIQSYNTRPF